MEEVRVVFTVTDKHGHYIKDLKRDDFKVLDDRKPAELRSFRSETDLPLQVGLLIDASNSVRDRFKFEQEAAIEFLNAVVRPHDDKAFVVGFDVTPEVTQDFTDNTEKLSIGIRALRAGGGTAMYDALYFACRDKLMKQERTGPVRNAIILLSDGEDNASHVTREEAIDMAQRADAIVYTISTNISGMKGQGDKVLMRIADATGGQSFFPFQLRDVSNAFLSIQEELRSQYAIAYKPENFLADGRYRTIEIMRRQGKGFEGAHAQGVLRAKAVASSREPWASSTSDEFAPCSLLTTSLLSAKLATHGMKLEADLCPDIPELRLPRSSESRTDFALRLCMCRTT